jgi:activator of HSP90 ATPase
MTAWSEDLSNRSMDEIVCSLDENRLWHRELRKRALTLVNNRLAKVICLEEYAVNREIGKQDTAECKRRGSVLAREISNRRFMQVVAGSRD